MHETECVIQPPVGNQQESIVDANVNTTTATVALTTSGVEAATPSSGLVKNEVIVNNDEEHLITIDGHTMGATYAPLKYNVSQLDTHEIIIETSR